MIGHFPLDIAGYTYLSTAQVLTQPFGIAYDSSRNRFAVCDNVDASSNNLIRILDGDTLVQITSITIATKINVIEYDSVNDRYVFGYEAGTTKRFSVMSPSTYSITDKLETLPDSPVIRDISIDYTNDRIYITGNIDGVLANRKVFVYKISDLSAVTSFTVANSLSVEPDPYNNRLYIACSNSIIRIYDLTTYTQISTFTGSGDLTVITPYHIEQDINDSNLMIIYDAGGNKVLIYDKTTSAITKRYSGLNSGLTFTMKGTKMYFPQYGTIKKIAILDKFY